MPTRQHNNVCPTCGFKFDWGEKRLVCSLCGIEVHTWCDNKTILSPRKLKWIGGHYEFRETSSHHNWCPGCRKKIHDEFVPVMAQELEAQGRIMDLVRFYEDFELLDKAEEVRKGKHRQTVKHVNVDLNVLIDQLRTGGLSIPYKCSSCGATITIDSRTDPAGLRFCTYCGSAINVEALESIIRSALS